MAAPASKATKEVYKPAPPRFQIASRLGAFRSTVQVSDPFGTSATFTINRAGSNAHKEWFSRQLDNDPFTLLSMEAMLSGKSPAVLSKDEEETVDKFRAAAEADGFARELLPIIDRLAHETAEYESRVGAMRQLYDKGKMRPSDMGMRGEKTLLEEALFCLAGWSGMPDADGGEVAYSQDAARELLQNDTPLEDCPEDIQAMVLEREEWTLRIESAARKEGTASGWSEDRIREAEKEDGEESSRIMIPGLTLGKAYQLFILATARTSSFFRDQVIEAAAKNSEPPSDGISSSGGGAPKEEPLDYYGT